MRAVSWLMGAEGVQGGGRPRDSGDSRFRRRACEPKVLPVAMPDGAPPARGRQFGEETADPWRSRTTLLLALLLAEYFGLVTWAYSGLYMDDAFIGFRYAANLIAGNGFTFNPGDRVEGITNAGWALLLAPFGWVMPLPLAAKLVALVLVGVTLALLYRVARKVASGLGDRSTLFAALPVLAVVLSATQAEFAGFSLLGMETPFLAAVLAGMALCIRRVPCPWALAGLGALAFVVRPEANSRSAAHHCNCAMATRNAAARGHGGGGNIRRPDRLRHPRALVLFRRRSAEHVPRQAVQRARRACQSHGLRRRTLDQHHLSVRGPVRPGCIGRRRGRGRTRRATHRGRRDRRYGNRPVVRHLCGARLDRARPLFRALCAGRHDARCASVCSKSWRGWRGARAEGFALRPGRRSSLPSRCRVPRQPWPAHPMPGACAIPGM